MKQLRKLRSLLAGPFGFFCLATCIVCVPSFFLIAGGDIDSDPSSWLPAVLLLAVGIAGVTGVLFRFAGADDESPDLARATLHEPAAQALLTRWLRRSRYYRFMGGVLGFIVGLPLDNKLIFSTLAGVALGGALAEVHVLGGKRRSSAVADLSVRSLRNYVNTTDVVAMATIAAGACAVIVARILGHGVDNAARIAVATLIVLAIVVGLQRLVAMRPRPALSPGLRQADDLLRFLAATQGFTRPAIAVAFFMLSAAVSNDATVGSLEGVSLVLVLLGLVWWYRGRHGRIPELAQRALAP